MYRQILIHQMTERIKNYYFGQVRMMIKTFQLKTVTLGINCAPFLAIRTLKQLSADCKLVYPHASDMVQQEIYVDDVLSGGHTLTEAKLKLSQLKNSPALATFPLKKITSNHKSLLEHIAREDLLEEDFLSLD